MEDVWRGEVQDLLSQISQLQAENKRLLKTPPLKEPPIHEEEPEKQEGGLSAAFPQNWIFDLFSVHFSVCNETSHVCLSVRISIWVFIRSVGVPICCKTAFNNM